MLSRAGGSAGGGVGGGMSLKYEPGSEALHRRVVLGYMTSDLKLSHPIGQLLVPILAGHRRQVRARDIGRERERARARERGIPGLRSSPLFHSIWALFRSKLANSFFVY